ncbi:aspartyl-tRNA(Asn)/glutamyl-tRNA(Gln) amidotransferase subunit A [Amycolatopsis arida]|uniref:Aspartyl-tRNA(Asn)/glutamyl-tRNA(Gln) amidotransferase subunit A n=1 Tax=Amycolatopsis arida TaxID=587909 RepID=A0A1I5LDW8_9PSEU|nr:amidase [Amycolatopsis arida]TDX93686.1 aspartyl-tRNA(Asn)/glutamyl-tRNA(Gln) amidotransferase subunit A [Amycolatopsis arida]SFO95490.1 aspartyl-tRNA(Asn)/glutamyl-tRNA(Gln) amidotransferase subunit A [Amycolatopsis arida]
MAANTSTLLTASELVAAYSSGEVSPVEATRAALDAIDQRDQELRAFALVDADAALDQAKGSEQRWREGNPIGWLDGVPTSIKDMFLTQGWPTLRGSRCIDPNQSWDVDSPVTARMREHGLVLLGKTTTPELGWKAVTDNLVDGITRNPWNPSRTPGGSSGGSGAAVAAGMGELSVGTDGGGSVRIPASFCGIVGFKPTGGRIPLYPASPFGPLAHAGPMARSVDDVALLLDVLAQPDYRDPSALPPPLSAYREAVRRDVRGLNVAYSADLGYVRVDPEVAQVVLSVVAALDEAGLRVEETDPGFDDPREAFELLWATGAAKWLNTFPPGSEERVDQGLRRVWEKGLTYSAADYLEASATRAALGIHMGEFHTRYDVLITPSVPIPPFEAGHDVPPGSGFSSWPQWASFSYPFNLTQQPAISVPAGFTSDGLPVGLQIVGPRHSDDLVLAVAKLVEEVRPWPTDRPAGTVR